MPKQPFILIVEDEWLIAEALASLLGELGFAQVNCCYDLGAGLQAAQSAHVDLALLDVNLKHELVFPLAERLRDAGAAIIFATSVPAHSFPGEWADALVLTKPVARETLCKALAHYGYQASA